MSCADRSGSCKLAEHGPCLVLGQRRIDGKPTFLCVKSSGRKPVEEALDRLSAKDPKKAELVKLRFFAGLTLKEAAAVVDISMTTADRYWAYARAWLHREIVDRGASVPEKP